MTTTHLAIFQISTPEQSVTNIPVCCFSKPPYKQRNWLQHRWCTAQRYWNSLPTAEIMFPMDIAVSNTRSYKKLQLLLLLSFTVCCSIIRRKHT